MRRWALGHGLRGQPPVAGRPVGWWLRLFAPCHTVTAQGLTRQEWPDGRPLLAQPQPLVRVFGVVRDELEALRAEQARRAAATPP